MFSTCRPTVCWLISSVGGDLPVGLPRGHVAPAPRARGPTRPRIAAPPGVSVAATGWPADQRARAVQVGQRAERRERLPGVVELQSAATRSPSAAHASPSSTAVRARFVRHVQRLASTPPRHAARSSAADGLALAPPAPSRAPARPSPEHRRRRAGRRSPPARRPRRARRRRRPPARQDVDRRGQQRRSLQRIARLLQRPPDARAAPRWRRPRASSSSARPGIGW